MGTGTARRHAAGVAEAGDSAAAAGGAGQCSTSGRDVSYQRTGASRAGTLRGRQQAATDCGSNTRPATAVDSRVWHGGQATVPAPVQQDHVWGSSHTASMLWGRLSGIGAGAGACAAAGVSSTGAGRASGTDGAVGGGRGSRRRRLHAVGGADVTPASFTCHESSGRRRQPEQEARGKRARGVPAAAASPGGGGGRHPPRRSRRMGLAALLTLLALALVSCLGLAAGQQTTPSPAPAAAAPRPPLPLPPAGGPSNATAVPRPPVLLAPPPPVPAPSPVPSGFSIDIADMPTAALEGVGSPSPRPPRPPPKPPAPPKKKKKVKVKKRPPPPGPTPPPLQPRAQTPPPPPPPQSAVSPPPPRPPPPPPPPPSPPPPPPPPPPSPSPPVVTPASRPADTTPSPSPPPSPPPPRPPPPPPPPPPRPPPPPPGKVPPRPSGDAYPPTPPNAPTFPPLSPAPPPLRKPPAPPLADASLIGRYEQVGRGMIVAVHMAAIPGTDRYLFMERPSGYHPDGSRNIAGFFDLAARSYTHIFSPDGLFCCGHTMLDSGDVLIVGGHQANAGYPDGMKSVRTFNKSCTDLNLRKVNEMKWRRWYPTPTLLPSGKVMIMGGTQGVGAGTANNPFWELYDPPTNGLTQFGMNPYYLDKSEQIYYPFNYVLPSGYMFTFCGRSGYILDYTTNTWRQDVPRLRGYASTQFPFTGTSVMLGLYPENAYEVDVVLFGGQKEAANKDLSLVANRGVNRLKLTYDAPNRNYTFTQGWAYENLIMGRVMPDSVLLPNGKVVILNGANTGLAGDSASGGESRANFPVLFAELYDPDKPLGDRISRLAPTTIARMYHSTACLTTNGTIIVAGCDRCYRFAVTPGVDYEPSPTSKAEYRVEIMSPPFFYLNSLKPTITSLQADVMPYTQPFTITYSFPTPGQRLTRVVLVAPCSCTHSFNTHQRLIGLEIMGKSDGDGVVIVRGPPNINIAPPGMYMVFLLNGDVYGAAKWVTLVRPAPGEPGFVGVGIPYPDAVPPFPV
ncbi:hypothetical protein HXX76_009368 [Chlamydomonas incerta]|uniref:Glyoxal or galactose oxidase n=1 Tax=Chlamydomonas incerta TaxID=51695 RepID=A0A835VXT7_CHLIN|nr:hypothetical protein HXX76_009368 [Chlamydomonas incerta]|eukprot:KAG2431875.1 hypothetical protein HXX76_009368 [Chlamydomonas incerta]